MLTEEEKISKASEIAHKVYLQIGLDETMNKTVIDILSKNINHGKNEQ